MISPDITWSQVLLLGEVLVDVFPDGSEVLGGAPFNVAWHLTGFGLDPLLVSRVGRDAAGRRVRQALAGWGMDASGLQEDPDWPTGRVEVRLDGSDGNDAGEPRFEILADCAWDRLDAKAAERALRSLPGPSALLYQGTLAERSPASREALAAIRKATGAPVFLDVNLRPPWVRRERTEAALQRARWVKLNREELEEIYGRPVGGRLGELIEAGHAVRERWSLEALVVTREEHGAVWITADGAVSRASELKQKELVDTVGAGDAVSAVAILGLLRGWGPETLLQTGVDFAAEICRRRGATPREPELYRRWRERLSEPEGSPTCGPRPGGAQGSRATG